MRACLTGSTHLSCLWPLFSQAHGRFRRATSGTLATVGELLIPVYLRSVGGLGRWRLNELLQIPRKRTQNAHVNGYPLARRALGFSAACNRALDDARITLNHREEDSSWSIWHGAALLPLLNCPLCESKALGKFCLR
jgi:hypothetical protein